MKQELKYKSVKSNNPCKSSSAETSVKVEVIQTSYDIITKGHGGRIDLKTLDGEGSEFIINLPLA